MIKKICKQCGNEFETIPSRIRNGRGKYCSRKCFHEFTRNKEIRVCQKCGNEFEAHLSDIKRGRGKFCSRKCFHESREKKIRVCQKCGNEFEAHLSDIKRGRGKFCSKSCAQTRENNANWQGGISFEPYCILFNNEFKERVREFWGRKCGISGTTEKENGLKLSVHHVNYDKQSCCNTTVPLFIPLSREYHNKTNFNRDYWEEMLTNYIMIWFNGECYEVKE
jgi:hypothetical protein